MMKCFRLRSTWPLALGLCGFLTLPAAAQTLLREYWLGLAGSTVPDLTNAPAFPHSPSGVSYPTLYEAPESFAEDYGTRLRGYLTAPQTGNYTFWIASDDQSELYLSSDDTPVNKVQIARVPTWTGSRVWEETRDGNNLLQKSAAIRLESGRRYYTEVIHKEGGGGDNVAVGWQLPDGTLERPIPGTRLSPYVASTNPPVILAEPASATVTTGARAQFRVVASGMEPLAYQWLRQGTNLPGATQLVFAVQPVRALDDGATFQCLVTNTLGRATSQVATLTVQPDFVSPLVETIEPSPGARLTLLYQVSLTFNEPVLGVEAGDLLINGGAFVTNVTGSGLGPYAFAFHPPSLGGNYEFTFGPGHGITDYSSNALVLTNWSYTVDLSGPAGLIRREVFLDIPGGGSIAGLLASPQYPNQPSLVAFDPQFEGPTGIADNYGTRMRGFVHPPVTGDYTFYIATDDQGELYLSTDETPSNKRLIASVPTWVGVRAWEDTRDPANAAQRSTPIRLEAGRRYYVEALQSEGGGGDNIAVAWRLPDGTLEGPIPGSRLSPFQSSTNPPVITTEPADLAVAERETAMFRVSAQGAEPMFFVWERNGFLLEGERAATLAIPNVSTQDNGATFRCYITNYHGGITSRVATLTVQPETIPPVLVDRVPVAGQTVRSLTQVEVLFSEPVRGIDAADLRVNGQPATNMSGVLAGPYVFTFSPPSAGLVQLTWDPAHGITDESVARNLFAGGTWTTTLDPFANPGDVVLNEFVAANESGLRDEDGEAQDWVELFNRGSNAVNLAGWALSDDPDQPGQWVFPSRTLAPRGFLIVFASGKDRRGTNTLHTNFQLSSAGEYLGLFTPESPRAVASALAPRFPEQRNDHSYGLDATGAWRYFSAPSPGASNGVSSVTGLVEPVHFSVRRGFFGAPFNLILTTPTPEAGIYYTTNGSEPVPATGLPYTGPLRITGTTILRAAAFKSGLLPSTVATHTYFFNLTAAQRSLPALSIVTASNHLWGPSGIIGIGGGTYASGVWQAVTTNDYHNPQKHGLAWERPTSAELIDPTDNGGFQINCGIRAGGGDYIRPRLMPDSKFTFHLHFRGDYGPGKLEYPFFPGSPVTTFDKIVLRAGMNDPVNPFIRDELARRLLTDVGQVSSHGTLVNLFINGQYRGYYNPTERIEEHFCQSWHGGGPEWDVLQVGSVPQDGDGSEWGSLRGYVAGQDVTQPSVLQEIEGRFDLVNFADYLLVNAFAGTGDWGWNNWRAARERAPGARFRYYIWDAEWSFGYAGPPTRNVFTGELAAGSELGNLYQKLKQSAEFRLLFADRIQKHFFNGGGLTDTNAQQRHTELRTAVAQVIPSFDNSIATTWIPQRRANLFAQFVSEGLVSPAPAPTFNQHGGRVVPGFLLTMGASNGVIYFTTNGADPRLRFTGEVTPGALIYSNTQPLRLDVDQFVRARTLAGTNWSALTEAAFTVGRLGLPLVISELMYNPVGGDAYEFIELRNAGAAPLDLSGFSFVGVNYTFPTPSVLPGGALLVLSSDSDPAAFAARYPFATVFGRFGGRLDNSGERIAVLDRLGHVVVSLDYRDDRGWPKQADGTGPSLVLLDPTVDPDDPANWTASVTPAGSPGTLDSMPPAAPPRVRLNEVMADNVRAVAVGTNYPDWVELRNVSTQAVDLAGWSLTDDSEPRRYILPAGTVLEAGALMVIYCDGQTNEPGFHAGFALDRGGETLALYDAATSRVDAVTYGLQVADFTVGRLESGTAWTLMLPTPGATNQPAPLAASTNLVLNEWLANPFPGADDWIELYNRDTNRPAALGGLYLGNGAAAARLADLSFLAPRGFLQLLADERPGPAHVDFKLPATGSLIALFDATGALLTSVTNNAQAEGASSGRSSDGGQVIVTFASGRATPGAPNYQIGQAVRLNEFMARNTTAVDDGTGRVVDWIELYNLTTNLAFDLSGFSLSVNDYVPGQWFFPAGTMLGQYLVLWCDPERPASLAAGPWLNLGRELSDESGAIYLFDRTGRLIDSIQYGFQIPDMSLAKIVSAWKLAASPTPGATNALAASLGNASSLRLNEWMAEPLAGEDWFELYNTNALPVSLSGVFLTDDPSLAGQTNFAADALSFVAPRGWIRIEADGATAAGRHHVNFKLDGEGESLRIYQSTVLVDAVDFAKQAPGVSQGRLADGTTNIVSFLTTPTPGSMNLADTDGDGLPDLWETTFGLSPTNAADAVLDLDHDGVSNRDEYLSGTHPGDPSSYLRLEARGSGGGVTLSFFAVAGKTYSVIYRDDLTTGDWFLLRHVAAPPVSRRVDLFDANATPTRFYRLVTPRR